MKHPIRFTVLLHLLIEQMFIVKALERWSKTIEQIFLGNMMKTTTAMQFHEISHFSMKHLQNTALQKMES